jgi:HlyD family secretion protein
MNKTTPKSNPAQKIFTWYRSRTLFIKALILILVIGIPLFVYNRSRKNGTGTVVYQTATAETGTLVVTISSSGQVATANYATVSTNVSGVVKKLYATNGQKLTAGAKIADVELDPESKQKYLQSLAGYQSAKNNLENAKTNLWTLQNTLYVTNQKFMKDAVERELSVDDPIYIEENATWLAAEANYKNQQQVINQAQTSLSSASIALQLISPVITAPVTGTLTGLTMQTGSALTQPATTTSGTNTSLRLAAIQTDALPSINLSLTEIDMPKVQVGDKATITIDAYPDKTFTGKVISIDAVGSISSGVVTYPTVIQLDSGERIFPNMSASANIITDTKDQALLVPTSAVNTQNGQSFVRILQDGQPVSVPVETGLSSDTQTEILSGIKAGDTVITGQSNSGQSAAAQSTSPFGLFGGRQGAGAVRNAGGGGNQIRIAR